MSTIAGALLPVAAIVALGAVLARLRFIEAAGWLALERLVYFVLFPVLLFVELVRAELSGIPFLALGLAIVLTQAALLGLTAALRRPLVLDGAAFTSLVQGVLRWNSYVAIALAPLLFGTVGIAPMALVVAVLTPLANLVSVLVLARHGRGQDGRARAVLVALVSNPLIVATLAGALWNQLGPTLPALVLDPLTILGRGALALGILSVGAGLRRLAPGSPGPLLTAVAVKLLLGPCLAFLVGAGLGIEGVPLGVLVLAFGMPTSSTSYILARMMGGDRELMAAIITVQTIGAIVTLPLVLLLVV